MNKNRIQELAEQGNKPAIHLSNLLKDPTSLLATVMITNNLANVSIVTLISLAVFKNNNFRDITSIGITITLMSIILFIFTGLLPKTYAVHNPEKVAMQMSYPIKALYLIFKPIVLILNFLAKPLMSKIGNNFGQLIKQLTAEEIKTMVDIGHETGVFEQYETKIIQSALSIDELPVSSIITPRVDIMSFSIDTSIKEALDVILEQEYSRMPVYEDNIDNIVGIIHVKDLIKSSRNHPENNYKSVQFLMREVFHVPENKTISELLKEMQAKRIQMAIVSDEYGGTSGLVSMEDILEEIVGEIRDEHDNDEVSLVYDIDKDTILVDAKLSVSEVNRVLDVDLPNSQTVGRLVFDTLGEVPKLGQVITINNVNLKIHEIDGIRVQKVLVSKFDNSQYLENMESEVSEVSL
ncbi:MAG: HlyC/CorC family transporter [Candidatus Sericytochromatia bacterium]|nr:HlyC/CorC family transporter [Candidatus Sericytochromatia bacterium]